MPNNKQKINIVYEFKNGPWGGGNQFLKALREELIKMNIYENDPDKSDLILFNSHQQISKILKLKRKYTKKIFVHRVDGPVFCTRGKNLEIDKLIFKFSKKIADFTIFQSDWSHKKCKELGFENDYTIIHNAPDNNIFNMVRERKFDCNKKIRLISTSWSSNLRKGFDTYAYLDKKLDFKKYEFIFIGNSPINFKNIKHIDPLTSDELAKELKNSDIFITASINDPCSNSLIEALSCGLPAIAFNDGGHPELIQKGGEIFNTKEEIIRKIEKVVNNYEYYVKNIPEYTIKNVTANYLNEFEKLNLTPKKISIKDFWDLEINILTIRIKEFVKNLFLILKHR